MRSQIQVTPIKPSCHTGSPTINRAINSIPSKGPEFHNSGVAAVLSRARDGRIVNANSEFLNLFGYSRHEVIGRTSTELNMWVDPARRNEVMRQLLADATTNDFDVLVRTKHGEVRTIRLSVEPISLGTEQGLLTLILDVTKSEMHHADRDLAHMFEQTFHHSPCGIAVLNRSGQIALSNNELGRLLGRTHSDLSGSSFLDLIHPEDRLGADGNPRSIWTNSVGGSRFEARLVRSAGDDVHATLRVTAVEDSDAYCLVHVYDITEQRGAIAELQQREEHYRQLVENNTDIIARFDRQFRHTYVNPAVVRAAGLPPSAFIGKTNLDLGMPEEIAHYWQSALERVFLTAEEGHLEFTYPAPDGTRYYQSRLTPEFDADGNVQSVLSIARDITEYRNLAIRFEHLAFHDPLTNLPNRALFQDRLGSALRRAARSNEFVAVLFIDLDGFKLVNDTRGHDCGDRLLTAVAQRLASTLRDADTLARFGGDEFAVIVEGLSDSAAAEYVASRLLSSLDAPIQLTDGEFLVGASIGVTLNAPGHNDPAVLLHEADVALYRAKASGRRRVIRFAPELTKQIDSRIDLATDMSRAIELAELKLFYQPIVELSTRSMVRVEALCRWQHPIRGLISNGRFLTMAEETGQIVEIGWWIIEEACRKAATWQAIGDKLTPFVVAVNLTPKQLHESNLALQVERILERTGLAPSSLAFELPESELLPGDPIVRTNLRALRALGVTLAIDNFGSGQSQLSSLRDLPISTLKTNRVIVRDIDVDPKSRAVAQAIISLAHALDMTVTANGVQSATQVATLRDLGCDRGQGYQFGPPVPGGEITRLLTGERAISSPVRPHQ